MIQLIENSSLIDSNGNPVFGMHKGPIKDLNFADFIRPGSKRRSASNLKRWIFLGVADKNLVFGIAIVHLGYLSNLFSYVFDRKEKRLKEYDFKKFLGRGTKFSGSSADGQVSFRSSDANADIRFSEKSAVLGMNIKNKLKAVLHFSRVKEPLSLVTKSGPRGYSYTNKEAGLSAEGIISLDNREYVIDPSVPGGALDYTGGVIKRKTFWNWACGNGLDNQGKKIGFNFSRGVNEEDITENAFWVDGKTVKVDKVDFKYDSKKPLEEWKIVSSDNKVNLTFRPEGERAMDFNIFIIKSFYHQPFGMFSGELADNGKTSVLDKVYGVTEEHEAIW